MRWAFGAVFNYSRSTARVITPASQVICNLESTTDILFTTDRTGGTTTYAWTNDNPSIGLGASGNGDILSFVGTNPGTSPEVATITITPTFSFDGHSCVGPTEQFTITVNPTGQVNEPADQVVCNGEATTVTFTTITSGGTVTYDWVNDNPSIGLPAIGFGPISFNAVNLGTAPDTAIIIVTPTFTFDGHSCAGPPEQFLITVNPTARVITPASQVICNLESTTDVLFTTDRTGGTTTYAWTNDNPSIGLGASGNGDILSFVGTNPGTSPEVATITITPTFSFDGHSCDGPTEQFTITVNPTAGVITPASQVICNLESTTDVLFTTDRTGGTTTYAWTNDKPSIGLAGQWYRIYFVCRDQCRHFTRGSYDNSYTPFDYDGKSCDGPTEQLDNYG